MVALGLSFFPDIDQMYRDTVGHAQLSNVVYLGWTLRLTAGLTLALYRPELATALTRRWPARPRRMALPTP